MQDLKAWLGRTETQSDNIAAAPLQALAATLDVDVPATALPPLWHWIFFTPKARAGEIGPDGHPRRGGFLPPVALPRRMWAGGRLEWHAPLHVGDAATRTSRIVKVDEKQGKSGALVFVTVRHEISGPRGLALTEEHDIVYRGEAPRPRPGAAAPPAQPAPADAAFAREIVPDPVLLFRYSALTFNGHRIHYDRRYATEVEGYPGLVVHGPLIATLLMDLARRERPALLPRRFSFKAVHPVFDIHPFAVCGRDEAPGCLALWARDAEGRLAMLATLETS
ncbi:MAG TPA: MaoC family dehydratase N-terminal domain-containing protein [Burkholderiaceae bacterium]